MKQETQQMTIFNQSTGTKVSLVGIPDFCGDFEKQMDFIASLPDKKWLRFFKQERGENR